jgi:hypothetical protein
MGVTNQVSPPNLTNGEDVMLLFINPKKLS